MCSLCLRTGRPGDFLEKKWAATRPQGGVVAPLLIWCWYAKDPALMCLTKHRLTPISMQTNKSARVTPEVVLKRVLMEAKSHVSLCSRLWFCANRLFACLVSSVPLCFPPPPLSSPPALILKRAQSEAGLTCAPGWSAGAHAFVAAAESNDTPRDRLSLRSLVLVCKSIAPPFFCVFETERAVTGGGLSCTVTRGNHDRSTVSVNEMKETFRGDR